MLVFRLVGAYIRWRHGRSIGQECGGLVGPTTIRQGKRFFPMAGPVAALVLPWCCVWPATAATPVSMPVLWPLGKGARQLRLG
jgi:hypothetical protein